MFCPECGSEFREGFFKCAECAVALVEQLPEGFRPKRRSFLPRDLAPIDIAGRPLLCQHCGYEQFAQSDAQLHSATLSFLNLEWLGKTADLFVCRSLWIYPLIPARRWRGLILGR